MISNIARIPGNIVIGAQMIPSPMVPSTIAAVIPKAYIIFMAPLTIVMMAMAVTMPGLSCAPRVGGVETGV